MLLLVGATLASAETKPTKDSAKPVPASQPAVAPGSALVGGAKLGAAKPNPDANFFEAKYGVKQMEPTEKDVTGEGFFQMKIVQGLLVVLLLSGLVFLYFFFSRTNKGEEGAQTHISSGQLSTGSSAELQQISQSIQSLNVRLKNIVDGQTSIASNITSLGTSLAPKVAEAAVTALTNSDQIGRAHV